MTQKAKCIEVRSADGKLMFSLHLYDQEIGTDEDAGALPGRQSENKPAANSQNDPSLMTDAQKRYLFRILAERGLEVYKAHEHLKELFRVESLKDVTKREASIMIEQLLEQAQTK